MINFLCILKCTSFIVFCTGCSQLRFTHHFINLYIITNSFFVDLVRLVQFIYIKNRIGVKGRLCTYVFCCIYLKQNGLFFEITVYKSAFTYSVAVLKGCFNFKLFSDILSCLLISCSVLLSCAKLFEATSHIKKCQTQKVEYIFT